MAGDIDTPKLRRSLGPVMLLLYGLGTIIGAVACIGMLAAEAGRLVA